MPAAVESRRRWAPVAVINIVDYKLHSPTQFASTLFACPHSHLLQLHGDAPLAARRWWNRLGRRLIPIGPPRRSVFCWPAESPSRSESDALARSERFHPPVLRHAIETAPVAFCLQPHPFGFAYSIDLISQSVEIPDVIVAGFCGIIVPVIRAVAPGTDG